MANWYWAGHSSHADGEGWLGEGCSSLRWWQTGLKRVSEPCRSLGKNIPGRGCCWYKCLMARIFLKWIRSSLVAGVTARQWEGGAEKMTWRLGGARPWASQYKLLLFFWVKLQPEKGLRQWVMWSEVHWNTKWRWQGCRQMGGWINFRKSQAGMVLSGTPTQRSL